MNINIIKHKVQISKVFINLILKKKKLKIMLINCNINWKRWEIYKSLKEIK